MSRSDNKQGIVAPGGELVDGYVVDRHLSRGTVLDVYSVFSRERDCLCVAKLLRNDREPSDKDRQRLLFEGHRLTELTHPHLVRGYAVLDESGDGPGPVVVMETLTGQTVSHLIKTAGALDDADTALLGRQLVSVLGYLHGSGIVHLDIKPSNLVAGGGIVRVLDLSLAQPPGPSSSGAGTHEYMAPEQLMGQDVGPPADVFGLGGVLFRAVTSRRPFPRSDGPRDPACPADVTALHTSHASPQLVDVIGRCLRTDPAERPDLAEIRTVLSAILDDLGNGHDPA